MMYFTYSNILKHLLSELMVMGHALQTDGYCTTLRGGHNVLQEIVTCITLIGTTMHHLLSCLKHRIAPF